MTKIRGSPKNQVCHRVSGASYASLAKKSKITAPMPRPWDPKAGLQGIKPWVIMLGVLRLSQSQLKKGVGLMGTEDEEAGVAKTSCGDTSCSPVQDMSFLKPTAQGAARSPCDSLHPRSNESRTQAGHRPQHGFLACKYQRVDDMAGPPALLLEREALLEHLAHVGDPDALIVGELCVLVRPWTRCAGV